MDMSCAAQVVCSANHLGEVNSGAVANGLLIHSAHSGAGTVPWFSCRLGLSSKSCANALDGGVIKLHLNLGQVAARQ